MCLSHFEIIKNPIKQQKNISYNFLGVLLSILSSLDLFHVFIVYLKHFYINTLKKFTTLLQFLILKHEKPSINYMFISSS